MNEEVTISRELLMEYEQDSNSLAYYKQFVREIAQNLYMAISHLLDGVTPEVLDE